MYNRYIRNDQGTYTRILEEEERQSRGGPAAPPPRRDTPGGDGRPPGGSPEDGHHGAAPPPPSGDGGGADGLSGTLRRLLDQLHLGDLDTGDLLLLAILYFLFREGADEELLAALGLLLIL